MLSFDDMIEELEIGQEYLVTFDNYVIKEKGTKFLMVFLGQSHNMSASQDWTLDFYHRHWNKLYFLTYDMIFRVEEARAPHRMLWKNLKKEKV